MNKLALYTASALVAAAFTGAAQAQDFFMPPMSSPSSACKPFVESGADESSCKTVLKEWTEYAAARTQSELADGQAPTQMGSVDAPMMAPPVQGMPNMTGKLYAAHVMDACEAFRGLSDNAGMTETVLAADQCLGMAHHFARQNLGGSTVNSDIEYVGQTLQNVAQKLLRDQTAPAFSQ